MQAVEIARPGPPEVLRLTERPVPALAPGEVLIRVAAAGVNRPDLLQRTGNYPPPPGITDIPGLEVAGEVVRVAPGVDTLRVGDRVCALVAGGGYAQFVAVPAVQCLPVPANASIEEAAALPETFFTVYLNVFERAELGHGETLLVHGGSSGIGTTAILMARAMGARVFVTAGTQRKCDACRALGAELAINYREQDFVPAVLAATEGRGVDVILDMVGGAYLPRNIAAAATDGRIALIATQGGTRAEVDLRAVLVKRLKIMGATLRPQTAARKGRLADALRTRIWPLFERGVLRPPPIHARFPLAQAAQAHAVMESGEHVGKLVLSV
ncbi:MAG: NAD(P)H-quinone oxidoreductase [Steroidobacteraceae bacterium]|nr:NAD(P)H-quinone oxidoreductase [Steroidobacteraceae bacterium]